MGFQGAGQLHIGARQHSELPDTFYVEVDNRRRYLANRIRAGLAATGRSDLASPAAAEPAPPAASRTLTTAGIPAPGGRRISPGEGGPGEGPPSPGVLATRLAGRLVVQFGRAARDP